MTGAGKSPSWNGARIAAYWLGGTPPRNTSVSVPRLTPERTVRTMTSSGPGFGQRHRPDLAVAGRTQPESVRLGLTRHALHDDRPGSQRRLGRESRSPTRKAQHQMAKVLVVNHVTLDGVMQAPARPDEDTRDGFVHGGWAMARNDELMVAKIGERMTGERAFLFGRRTYEDFYAVWPNRPGNPFSEALANAPKYVASAAGRAAALGQLDPAVRRRRRAGGRAQARAGRHPDDVRQR